MRSRYSIERMCSLGAQALSLYPPAGSRCFLPRPMEARFTGRSCWRSFDLKRAFSEMHGGRARAAESLQKTVGGISRELHRTIDVVSTPLLTPSTEASVTFNSSAGIVGELLARYAAG